MLCGTDYIEVQNSNSHPEKLVYFPWEPKASLKEILILDCRKYPIFEYKIQLIFAENSQKALATFVKSLWYICEMSNKFL